MARRSVSPVGLALVLCAAASGCASHVADQVDGSVEPPDAPGAAQCRHVAGQVDGPVDYSVTGGFFGGGDGTALHVELDGTVTRHTDQQGTQTAMLDRVTLDDLRQKIVDAQFSTLMPQYHCNCADDYIDNVSVHVDASLYTVAADRLASLPGCLKTVIDTLKAIHQSPLDWR